MTEFEFQRRQYQFDTNPDRHQETWDKAADHRAMVTRILIDKGGEREGKLAILGAGECSDINLEALREWFEEVHLFDLDGKTVWNGVDFQGLAGADWIQIHGGIDVSGMGSVIAGLKDNPYDDGYLVEIIRQSSEFRLEEFSNQFDVVASTCLLSQIFEHAIASIGERHSRLIELLTSLRLGHILMLADMCRPGGIGNLIFDFVSSESLPGMIGTKGDDLTNLLGDAVKQNNFFHGMSPLRINDVLLSDQRIASQVERVRMTKPWVWQATTRHYAVLAAQFCRKRS